MNSGIRFLLCCIVLGLLTACAKPTTGGFVEPVMEPEVVVTNPGCGFDDDGIGGTGCQPN